MNRADIETLEHASRLLHTFDEVRAAYIEQGWVSVGMLLSTVDPEEIREVATWVADFAQTRSGTDSDRGEETSPPNDGTPPMGSDGTVRADPPSPSALVTTPDLSSPEVAGSSAPYDWETEGFGGT